MFCLDNEVRQKGTAVALGYFDGIHIGHKAVLSKAVERAKSKNLVPVIMLFDIHPRKLISGKVPPVLTSEKKKRQVLEDMGFTVVEFNFREAMDYAPEKFVEHILIEKLNARVVTCGYDYRYGKGGKGDSKSLEKELAKRNIEFYSLEPILLGEETISSTKIRELIAAGEIEKANTMLGYHFCYDFVVEKGDGLGRTLGFPTINQFFKKNFIVPRYGVYASATVVDGKRYASVTNVGIRPTFKKDSMRSETCILDFSGNLYGSNVEVSLIAYLRDEIAFESPEELKKAIEKDIIKARKIYNEVIKNG